MIQHVWSVLCQSASVDKESRSLSLFNVIESITIFAEISSQPIRLPIHFAIVSLWRKSMDNDAVDKGKTQISFCAPDGTRVKKLELELDLSDSLFHRQIINSGGIVLSGPGLYKFLVEKFEEADGWKLAAELPFEVVYETALQGRTKKTPSKSRKRASSYEPDNSG